MRPTSLFLSFLCTCLIFFSLSQNLPADTQKIVADYQQADRNYTKALHLARQKNYSEAEEARLNRAALDGFVFFLKQPAPASKFFDSLRFLSRFRAGELCHYFDSLAPALHHYNEAIASAEKKHTLADSFLFKPLVYAGFIYANQNKLDSAMLYFNRAETIQEAYSVKLAESERLYNNLGAMYFEYGNYRQAKNYFQKAADVLPKTHEYYRDLFINYHINLATVLFKMENYDSANTIYQKLLPYNKLRDQINNSIGLINFYLGAPEQAIAYFKKTHYSNYLVIGLYNDMANAYVNLRRFDSAEHYLHLALQKNTLFNPSNLSIDHGRSLKLYGDLEAERTQLGAALNFYQQAIHQFYPSFSDTAFTSNPLSFSGAFSYINLFYTLTAKADVFHRLYQQDKNLSWEKRALDTYWSAYRLMEYVARTYDSDEARLFLDKIAYGEHAKPIDIAYALYRSTGDPAYFEALYSFDQLNKASVLSIRQQLIDVVSRADTSLVNRERVLRSAISRLSVLVSRTSDSATIAGMQADIREKEITLGKIQEQLYQSAGMQNSNIPKLSFLRRQFLDDRTAIISYHLAEDKLTTLLVRKDTFGCRQENLFTGYHNEIQDYIARTKSSSPERDTKDAGKKLFELLFAHLDLSGIDHLIIIPDDELNYLSFEALQDSQGKYLIEKFSIQYQYATALLKKQSINFSGHGTAAFAPFAAQSYHDSVLSFSSLPYSLTEIEALKGAHFVDSRASRTNFLQALGKYGVIHLATHAVAGTGEEAQSFIAFSPANPDFILHADEISNLPLDKTGLVILSACETGGGSLVRGEGVMSLSRAFAYAGCANVITSLWNANDFSTAYLTTRVHQYLDKGFSIDRSLQKAKLDYLSDPSINPRLKHPYYWSHLVFIGTYAPQGKEHDYRIPIVIGVLLLIAVIFLWLKIKSRKKREGLPMTGRHRTV